MGQNYRIAKILDIVFGYLKTWIIFITWTCLLADASSKIPVRHEVNSSMIVSSDRNRNHANRWFRVSSIKKFFFIIFYLISYVYDLIEIMLIRIWSNFCLKNEKALKQMKFSSAIGLNSIWLLIYDKGGSISDSFLPWLKFPKTCAISLKKDAQDSVWHTFGQIQANLKNYVRLSHL